MPEQDPSWGINSPFSPPFSFLAPTLGKRTRTSFCLSPICLFQRLFPFLNICMLKHLIQLQKVPLNGRIWQPGSDQLKWDSMCPQSVLGENSVRRDFDWSTAIERFKEEQSPHWQRKITQRGFLTVLIYLLDGLILDGRRKGHSGVARDEE